MRGCHIRMSFENCRLMLNRQNKYEFSFASVIGTRNSQEDYFGVVTSERSIVACICDGMGGLENGAEASEMSVDIFTDEISSVMDLFSYQTPEYYLSLLDKMDHDVHRIKKTDGSKAGAGSTLVSVFICDGEMKWLSVGDSTIYLVRAGKITRLNQYHNYQTLLDDKLPKGLIDKAQYLRESRKGHALTGFIGMGGISRFDTCQVPFHLERNDMIVLCSDGVTNRVSPDETMQAVSGKSASRAVDVLMDLLDENSRGKSMDNATTVIIRIK